ncbi:MAG: transcription-repair coupling factor [Phycisphaeraceae bacterium]|nr:transcription-repair coupling factor [Phycisphaeraceae bacterium]
MDLLSHLAADTAVQGLCAQLALGRRVIARGSQGSSTAFVAGAVGRSLARPVLLVTAHLDEADESLDELLDAGIRAARFPALEVLPGESQASLDLFAERLAMLRSLPDAPPQVLIAPIQALMQPVPAPAALATLSTTIRRGQRIDFARLIKWLVDAGYSRQDAIDEPGDFAVRGGILDIFLPAGIGPAARTTGGSGVPIRLDFFGDDLEKLNEIDLDTMASDRAIDEIEIVCASLEKVLADADAAGGKAGGQRVGVIDYMKGGAGGFVCLLHETMEIVEQARGYFERVSDGGKGIFAPPALLAALQQRVPSFAEINQFSGGRGGGAGTDAEIELPVRALGELPADAADGIRHLAAEGAHADILIVCQNDGELSRLRELVVEHAPSAGSRLHSRRAFVSRGFVWGEEPRPALVVPYHELIHRFESRRRGSGGVGAARLRAGRAIDTFLDFAPGDYVVHRDHGIALFRGLIQMKPREVKAAAPIVLPGEKARKGKRRAGGPLEPDPFEGMEEYLTLEFDGGSKLHVPCNKIDQVQKYVGGMGGRSKPQLSTIGGNRWKNQKERVAESVRDLAAEMLRIRAARESLPGVRYPADTAWQREFEDEFPYDETEDQIAALAEIKKDMQQEKPMDRLLCGDVGYGKTEVAIRAAFKAVEFGKQVAVLVPTTVLAEQHERTFKSRFADYPFRVESISRFKTNQEVNKVLADLRKGQVDVIIGTHRLLSKDVKFADLGLVVIDEEQRFGVEHKERLLSLRMTVDVLTLSATPIPRTLHLSMLGLRDISSLATPPLDRRAVVTEVIPYNERRIQQAIARELARNGQVFFVHNRVYDITSVADDVRRLAPDAEIVIGHGQMPDGELEEVMLRFMRRDTRGADILVSTTIIESGIDIPTANTMIIDGADRFGLADLHQLRGRVGRGKHRGYCYLLLPKDRPVPEKALKRLKAIEEFNMLGAGFKIAMRDLEIRGAGNILGPEQSGHIAAVGYEMYCQLLDREVKRLRNEPTHVASETSIEIGVSGMLPKPYILSDQRRMEAYRRIAVATTTQELERVEQELTGAYGQIPPAARRLLDLAELRILASVLRIRSISLRGQDVLLRARPDDAAVAGALLSTPSQREGAGRGQVSDPALTSRTQQPPIHVTVLQPKKGEESSEVYFRPPPEYLRPETLLAVLRRRLKTDIAPPAHVA